ncbi:hypothetical protein CRENBAI_009433 [Crenichthys baileyi]|uniref:Uncharacterized protein n=1 Tax=Crenichthys baileyi TaxID=28760 RepID=A0AAV9QQW9_9TELE
MGILLTFYIKNLYNHPPVVLSLQGGWCLCSAVTGRVHPGQVASPSQGNTETHRANNHAYTKPYLWAEKPNRLLEEARVTHERSGRTCKLHAARPGGQDLTFSLQGNSPTNRITVKTHPLP